MKAIFRSVQQGRITAGSLVEFDSEISLEATSEYGAAPTSALNLDKRGF